MKIHCVADLHGNIPNVPTCDLFLIAGDFWGYGYCFGTEKAQLKWLEHHLAPWFNELKEKFIVKEIVGIAGNHDGIFFNQPAHPDYAVPPLNWRYLENTATTIDIEGTEIQIWGTPWTPWFNDWCFGAPREDKELETFMYDIFEKVPTNTDILISHGPPYEILDLTNEYEHAGCRALRDAIDRINPALVVCGHIHEAMGIKTYKDTLIVNAAIVGPRGNIKRTNGFTLEGDTLRTLALTDRE